MFPEASPFANQMAVITGLQNTALYCNLQLTKDGIGFCLTDLRLQNSTNIEDTFPHGRKSYNVNGKILKGWFSVDITSSDLFNRVNCMFNFLHFIAFSYSAFSPFLFNLLELDFHHQ